jgi:glycogen(starch) synthase
VAMADTGGSAIEASEPSVGPDLAGLRGLRVLRLCSVFEPATLNQGAARYDVIGGMQNHAAELTRCPDRMGVRQQVLTSRLDGPPGRAGFGRYGQVARTGLRTPLARQAWAAPAARLALGDRSLVSLVHAHFGENLAVLPLARLAAWRHGCPLVVTVHVSVRHTPRVTSARSSSSSFRTRTTRPTCASPRPGSPEP